MTHEISLDDYKGFDTRSVIAMSTEDKKKLELVCLASDNFTPCFKITSKNGVTNCLSLEIAIEYYNKA